MERYSEYKDSGVQWLGEIPSHWKVVQLGKIFEVKAGGDAKTEYYSDIQDVEHPYPVYTNTKSAREVYAYTSVPIFNANTITVTGRGEIGHAIYRETSYDAIIRLLSLEPKLDVCCKYYAYYIDVVIPFSTDSAAIGQLSAVQLRPKLGLLFSVGEQQAIVSYLDIKCSKLDTLVENKEKEISLLAEMKQRIIADAVTRGLNPNVKFKSTNIPWLPEIPEHWEMRKIKYLFKERSEKNHPNEEPLCATQSRGVIPQSMYEGRVVIVNKGFEKLKFVKKGDFVISLRSFQGGIEYAYYQGIISAAYTILFPNMSEMADYYRVLFKSYNFIQLLQTCVTGIRKGQNINYPLLSNKEIPVPPLSEQQAIVSYITERTAKIDSLIEKLNKEIECIKEYKQRLISDVVTGQIKVS